MALPLLFSVQLSGGPYDVVNAPALWLGHSLTDAGMTPPGEFAAWVVVPAVMIVLQWSVVGTALGLVTGVMAPVRTGKNGNEVF